MTTRFVALVPVKTATRGKSRIRGIADLDRRALAVAFALDTLAAAQSTSGVVEVLVVTDDVEIADLAARSGCRTLGDHGGLNSSLRSAAAHVDVLVPGAVAVAVCADLPALVAMDLRRALDDVRTDRACFVADRDGSGTTTYAAPPGMFDPRFGVGSRSAHLAAGALELTADVPTLRHDVDTLADLETLESRGLLGMRTSLAWHAMAAGR